MLLCLNGEGVLSFQAFPAEPSLWNTRLAPGVVGMCCVRRSARTVCPKCQWKDSQRKGWSMEFKNRLWVQVCKSYGENYFLFFNFTLKGGKEFYFFFFWFNTSKISPPSGMKTWGEIKNQTLCGESLKTEVSWVADEDSGQLSGMWYTDYLSKAGQRHHAVQISSELS